jgi:hypothetical protein
MSTPAERPLFLTDLGRELSRLAREQRHGRPARGDRLRSMALSGLAVLLLAAGAGAATGVVPLPGGGPDFVAPQATGRFSPSLSDELTVLTRARTNADSMGEAGAHVAGPDGPAPGSSLRVTPPAVPSGTPHASATDLNVWLLPTASGRVAMYAMGADSDATGPGTGFSADREMVRQGHAFMTTNFDVVGLVPDGVRSVRVKLGDASVVELPVADNVFGAHFDAEVRAIAFDGMVEP